MSGHFICEYCGDEGGVHQPHCRELRPMEDRWKGELHTETRTPPMTDKDADLIRKARAVANVSLNKDLNATAKLLLLLADALAAKDEELARAARSSSEMGRLFREAEARAARARSEALEEALIAAGSFKVHSPLVLGRRLRGFNEACDKIEAAIRALKGAAQ